MNRQQENWETIEACYEAALARDGESRVSYLAALYDTDRVVHDAVVWLLTDSPTEVMSTARPRQPVADAEDLMADLTGRQISNIRVEGPIGEGGMGTVYRGFDRKLRRRVAIKTLRQGARSATTRARFVREARILSSLSHPRICQVYDLVSWHGRDVLVLELIDGETLRHAGGRLNDRAKLRTAEAVAEAIAVAHREQIIHRDLKPDNVMLTAQGDVKVLDFGVARSLAPARASDAFRSRFDSDTHPEVSPTPRPTLDPPEGTRGATETQGVAGTLAYMSPEQARGERLTLATDLFSFGVVLQELFTGRRAVPELPVADLIDWVGAGKKQPAQGLEPNLARLIADLRRRVPSARPTANECLDRIRALIDAPARRRRTRRRSRRRWLTAAGLAATLATTVTLVDHSRTVTRDQRETIKSLISLYEPLTPRTGRDERTQSAPCRDALQRAAEAIRQDHPGADALVDASAKACR